MIQVNRTDVEKTNAVVINQIEIIVDDSDKVEIYHCDDRGRHIEGGTFDRNAFLDAVIEFYNRNF